MALGSIRIGSQTFSRMMIGGNPFSGFCTSRPPGTTR